MRWKRMLHWKRVLHRERVLHQERVLHRERMLHDECVLPCACRTFSIVMQSEALSRTFACKQAVRATIAYSTGELAKEVSG
jgi:hypothetical protein